MNRFLVRLPIYFVMIPVMVFIFLYAYYYAIQPIFEVAANAAQNFMVVLWHMQR